MSFSSFIFWSFEIIFCISSDSDKNSLSARRSSGDVVGSKTPQYIFFGADLADIEAVGVEILDLS